MFARPLVTMTFDADPEDGIALCRALAPSAKRMSLVLRIPVPGTVALGTHDLRDLEADLVDAERALDALASRLARDGIAVRGEIVPHLSSKWLESVIGEHSPDVVVFGRFGSLPSDTIAGFALDCARRFRVCAVAGSPTRESIGHVVCPFDGSVKSLARIGPFLRDHIDESQRVTLFSFGPRDHRLVGDPATIAAIAGVHAEVSFLPITEALFGPASAVEHGVASSSPDLIVVASESARGIPPELVRAMILRSLPGDSCPVLFVPTVEVEPIERTDELDAFDAVLDASPFVRLERISTLSGSAPIPDQQVDLVSGGARIARLDSHESVVRIPPDITGPVGVGRAHGDDEPILVTETAVDVVSPFRSPVALIDSRIDGVALVRVREELERGGRVLVAVRLVPNESAISIRRRLHGAGFARPLVVDVRDILDEGDATDVPVEVAPVRLSRAAARMRSRGTSVDAIVTVTASRARGRGFAVFSTVSLEGADARAREAFVPPSIGPPRAELDIRTGSLETPGNQVELVLDNETARRKLVGLIDSARERFHGQWYIVEDDDVGREVESALVRAAERGVSVRILVDSLYSLHESFGAKNTLLARLSLAHGIEVRVANPVGGVPSVEELKRRDHRKLVIVDGRRGIVSGRNLGNTYYRSFSEVRIGRDSTWRDVPWLDAGAALSGPVVADLDESFREAWTEAGGPDFAIDRPPPIGATTVRFVVHHGLADAYTLEAYLSLIDRARERIIVVNGFPLQLEVQRAMLRAISRGVRLTLLVGNVRPLHGDKIAFEGGMYRSLADVLVRARMDALIAAGADVREVVLAPLPGWDPELTTVRPYVHAKLVWADGRFVAIGSANLDVTAGYWESEALVVVEDESVARTVETQLEPWFAISVPIGADDPSYREGLERRAWFGRIWPTLLG